MARWNMENFPFIPTNFRYKVKGDPRNRGKEDYGAGKQLKIINSLMKLDGVGKVISVCDFDREGQIIGDTITYNPKTQKKVYRLLQNIKSNTEMRPLLDAGISRQLANWVIIGTNLTSVATLQYQKVSGQAFRS